MSGGQGVFDKFEEATIGLDWNDVEGDENGGIESATDDIAVVGIEDGEVVLGTVVGGGRDGGEALGCKPLVDPGLGDGNDLKAWLGDDAGQVVFVRNETEKGVEFRGQGVLEA